MDYEQIVYRKDQHTAIITLNRPEKLNAYSEVMVHEILAALADARDAGSQKCNRDEDGLNGE